MDAQLAARAERHLARVLDHAAFRIEAFEPISGNGLSRTVIRIAARIDDEGTEQRHYVMLLEQAQSPVAPNRDAEYGILRALHGVAGMLVPPAYWVEHDPEPLGAPFVLTGLLPGTTNPRKLLEPGYATQAPRLITQSFEILGTLAALDVGRLGLGPAFAIPAPDQAAARALERCERTLRDHDCTTDVITQAALRFLHRTPVPAPARLSVVHGDYRLGNYLFEPQGITGVIDWEMVHVGDALEDLAWALLGLWDYGDRPGLIGGVLTPAQAIAAWCRTSGLTADPAALHWWTVLCHVKAIGIWATARHQFATDPQCGFMPGLVGYALIHKHEAILADLLHPMAPA